MQQILNNQERNQAFLKFLLFFLITIVLVIAAVFFNYRLPTKENAFLQSEIDSQRQQENTQQTFVGRMEEAIVLLDSMDKSGTNVEQVNLLLNRKISELAMLQQKDNTLYGKMNKTIVDKLGELQARKKELQSYSEKINRLSAFQAEYDKCKNDLAIANAALDGFRSRQ